MECQSDLISHILLLHFKKDKRVEGPHREICVVYNNAASERQNWFMKFSSGHFSVKALSRSGRPKTIDEGCDWSWSTYNYL